MRERNEHRQEESEKVAEITKKSVKTKDKQDEEDELQRRNSMSVVFGIIYTWLYCTLMCLALSQHHVAWPCSQSCA